MIIPAIDALRRTTLGGLVLGTGFDPRDIAAYAAGILLAVGLERVARGQRMADNTEHSTQPRTQKGRR